MQLRARINPGPGAVPTQPNGPVNTDPNKLQDMLRTDVASVQADTVVGLEGVASAPVHQSETALKLDRWGLSRGRHIAEQWAEIGSQPDEDGETPPQQEFNASIVADCHGALFEPAPKLADNPADPKRAAWLKQCMETPEYRSLHNQTCLRAPMAAIAAKSLFDQFAAYAEATADQDNPGPGGDGPGGDNESISDQVGRIRSTQQALKDAQKDIDAAEGLGAGLGMGDGGQIDTDRLAEAFGMMRRNSTLRDIALMAGRMIARCRSLQRQKLSAPHGEVTGIELTGEVGRLLPLELAMVAGAVPELQLHALYRLAQRRMFGYRHKLKQPVQAGPIVVGVDESGSMKGDRIIAAKGLALAMAWLARQQKRWIALYSFSGSADGRYIAIPPGVRDDKALLEWCCDFMNGGTTLQVSCETLPQKWWPELVNRGLLRGRTDHIIITDADVRADAGMIEAYRKWAKAEECRTYGLIVAHRAGSMAQVCDRHWLMPDLSLNNAAVEEVLSI